MNKKLSAKVESIRKDFIKSLPRRRNKIQALANRLFEKTWDLDTAKDLMYETHNLRGFSGSHGLMKLNELSGNTENIIESFRKNDRELGDDEKNELQDSIDKLISEMREVQSDYYGHCTTKKTTVAVSPNSPLILIVDDNHQFCESLSGQLENLGYRTKFIYSTKDLEQSINTYAPKAIFMDIIFRDEDESGTEIISHLRSRDEISCPIVYMSAKDDLTTRLAAVRSGGLAFLNKSFNLGDLKNVLDNIIPLHQNRTYKVLIIDDDKSMASYCSAILENAKIKVMCLDSPFDVFEYIINFDPDVILLDMYMPNISGIEMSSIIRQHQAFSTIPIVIMSGETDINKQFRTRSAGADDFILKPFKPHHLVDIILNRIHRSRQTKKLIYTDGLTGLILFPKVKEQILNLMESCLRYELDFSFALLDLDYFKAINDKYGHLVGDHILREFAEFLTTRVRNSDMVTRYGGEEFAIVFPYTNSKNSAKALNSIRDSFAEIVQHASAEEFKVTFSAGISSIENFKDLESLLAGADQALYVAKEEGRNRIQIAGKE